MIIRSFEDTALELQKLRDELDTLKTHSLDMKGRRIMNLGDAIDGSDAVTKSFVTNIFNTFQTAGDSIVVEGFVQVDFSVPILSLTDDISSQYPVIGVPRDKIATPVFCGARLKTADSSGLSLRWNHVNIAGVVTDMFNGSTLDISSGGKFGSITRFKPNIKITDLDYFKLDITNWTDGAGLYTFMLFSVE